MLKTLPRFDFLLFLPMVFLFMLGYSALYSTSRASADNQIVFFSVSLVFYFLFSFIYYHSLVALKNPIFILSVFSLVAVYVLGEVTRGSSRWFTFGEFGLQPSEFAKITLVISLAGYLSKVFVKISLSKLLGTLTITLPLAALVFIQPDLGTSIVLIAVWFFMVFYSGIPIPYIISIFSLGGIISYPFWNILKEYQKNRLISFFNPALDPLGRGYNVIQAKIAVGSGKILGRGFGRGTQSHLRFLPEYHTDFIFASFAEEWGFLGTILMLFLFLFLLLRILQIAKSADCLGSLICVGVFSIILVQLVVNVGMNIGIMPITGIPFPLISYGGSSLLTMMIFLGVVQSVAIHKSLDANDKALFDNVVSCG